MTGNMGVNWHSNKYGKKIGEVLIEMIEDAMNQDIPLRFLVFENTGKFGNERGDATLHVTFGQARPPERQETRASGRNGRETPPRYQRTPPPFPPAPDDDLPDSVVDDPVPEPEPVPRRRATRR